MRAFACFLIPLLVACGCTASNEAQTSATQSASTTSGSVTIEFRNEPDPPKAGDNSVEVTVKGADGAPVTDATVKAVFSMPAMPSMNMPAMRSETTLAHESAGRYRGMGQLSMSGTWNVSVTVMRGSEELGRNTFSIIAK